jgi:hypothetical protein
MIPAALSPRRYWTVLCALPAPGSRFVPPNCSNKVGMVYDFSDRL